MIGVSNRATELTDIIAPPPQNFVILRPAWTPVWSAWIPVWSASSPVEVGGKYSFTGHFRPLPNTELERYLAKVRVASSSLVSRSTP